MSIYDLLGVIARSRFILNGLTVNGATKQSVCNVILRTGGDSTGGVLWIVGSSPSERILQDEPDKDTQKVFARSPDCTSW